jgi:hypothetical protein
MDDLSRCAGKRFWSRHSLAKDVLPPSQCCGEAEDYRAIQYQRLSQNLRQMMGCLASGYPFTFGFVVYDSFTSPQVAQTGIVPMPQMNEQMLPIPGLRPPTGDVVVVVAQWLTDAFAGRLALMRHRCATRYTRGHPPREFSWCFPG